MKMIKKILSIFLIVPIILHAQNSNGYPLSVGNVLNKTVKNRKELEGALNYFYNKGDSLKIKAINFLISNMDIHYSYDYYWADSNNNKVEYNELKYPTFKLSLKAFDSLKTLKGRLHPIALKYRDIDTIKTNYLIDNIENAFKVWDKNNCSFDDFCEYILPYRISVEPLQDWRRAYEKKYSWLRDSSSVLKGSITKFLIKDINEWFTCMYELETRTEPIPRYGALQLLHRKKGFCEDVAALASFALRTQGLPSSVDMVPFWATASGSHTLNFVSLKKNDTTHFDVLFKTDSIVKNDNNIFHLVREPGKVYRQTYSKQNDALANIIDKKYIPNGILKEPNIKDVTAEYWDTREFNVTLKPNSVAFACVLNYLNWEPIAWSKSNNKGDTKFKNMCTGAVYLPMYFINNKMIPAAYPVALGKNHLVELKTDTINLRTIKLTQQEHYIMYKTGKKYKLYYWNNKWKKLSEQTAAEKCTELTFEKVPKNALLLLVTEHGNKKERPFMITDDNKRIWF